MYIGPIICAFVIYKSINIIRANEYGITILLGVPINTFGPGLNITFWPFYILVKYPAGVQEINFAVPSIITAKGKFEGYEDVIEPAEINLPMVMLYYFNKDKLKQTVKNAPGTSEKSLSTALVPYTQDVIRTLGGRLPWRLINQERFKFLQIALSRMVEVRGPIWLILDDKVDGKEYKKYSLTPCDGPLIREDQLMSKSPFVQFGLKDVSLMITDINFTDPALDKAITDVEKSRLEVIATKRRADGERYKRREEGFGSAEAREAMIKVIQVYPDLEVLLTLREMAQGTSNTILYQIPTAIESKVRDLLGGNSLGEITRLLNPEDQKFVRQIMDDTLKALAEKSRRK